MQRLELDLLTSSLKKLLKELQLGIMREFLALSGMVLTTVLLLILHIYVT